MMVIDEDEQAREITKLHEIKQDEQSDVDRMEMMELCHGLSYQWWMDENDGDKNDNDIDNGECGPLTQQDQA